MRMFALLLIFLSAGGAAVAQRGAEAILTKTEARSMGDDALTRRLFGGLAPIVLPVPDRGRPGVPPTQQLRELSFFTIPVASGVPGLCRTEKIQVEFTPAGPPAGADTPVRPRRFSSEPVFVVRDWALLMAYPRGAQDWDEARNDQACAQIDPRSTRIIWAENEYSFHESLMVLQEFIGASRGGHPPSYLDCRDLATAGETPLNDAQCLARITALDPHAVIGISSCNPPTALVCLGIEFDGYSLHLARTPDGGQTIGAKLVRTFAVPEEPSPD